MAEPERGELRSRDGLRLYREIWRAQGPRRGRLLVVHGGGDHCGRYRWPIEYFTARGFDCTTFDYRGHGRSDGQRGHCNRFGEFLDDLDAAIELAASGGDDPLYILAHSHGALVATRYFLEPGPRVSAVRGLILSSPFFALKFAVPGWKIGMAKLLSRAVPRLPLSSNLPASQVSHEPSIVAAYQRDTLVHDKCTARWYTELTSAQHECVERAGELTLPLLTVAAGDDRIVNVDTTRRWFDRVGSRDKQLVVYPGLFHEVMNEIERERVFVDIERWLDAHLGTPAAG